VFTRRLGPSIHTCLERPKTGKPWTDVTCWPTCLLIYDIYQVSHHRNSEINIRMHDSNIFGCNSTYDQGTCLLQVITMQHERHEAG
jgi:hypothetical protein